MMDCTELSSLLEPFVDKRLTFVQQAAMKKHLGGCDSCASALYAVEALHARRSVVAPTPRTEFFAEVIQLATQGGAVEHQRTGNRFWIGAGLGGALAAGITFALLSFNSVLQPPEPSMPQLTIALNETRDVNVAIDSPTELLGAQIRVVLTGTVALVGFEDQSELRWATDLDRGINRLSLPVTMVGSDGGQVIVEVIHVDRHEVFVIALRSTTPRASETSIPSATAA